MVATRPGGMSPVDTFLARAPSAPIIGVSLRPLPGSRRGDADDAIVESVAAVLKPRLSRWNAYVLPLPLYGASDGPVLDRLRRALGETAGDRILEWSAGPTSGHLAEGDRPDGDRQLRARQGPSDAAGRHLERGGLAPPVCSP